MDYSTSIRTLATLHETLKRADPVTSAMLEELLRGGKAEKVTLTSFIKFKRNIALNLFISLHMPDMPTYFHTDDLK